MSDEEDAEGVYLNAEDIVRVIDLDDFLAEHGQQNGGPGDVDPGAGDDGGWEDVDDDEMDTGGASAAPTQDDSVVTFTGHQSSAVICCKVHPSSSDIVVTGGQDDKAVVWNPKTGAPLFECSGHGDTIVSVDFSSDGSMVATADMKGLIQVWSVPSGALAWYFEVGEIEWLQWHQMAPVLLAGTKDGEVWMWKVPAGDCKTFASHGAVALCGRILPDGKHCCVGYDDGVTKFWSMKDSEAVFTISGLDGHNGSVLCMDVKGDKVVTGSEDGTAKVINLTSGKVTSTLQCNEQRRDDETDSVEGIALSIVNDYMVTGTLSGKLVVWELSTKAVRHRFEHPYGIVKIVFSPTTPHFYTACLDGCVRKFDSQRGTLDNTYQGHTNGILDFCLAKDESYVITASDDSTSKVFSLAS